MAEQDGPAGPVPENAPEHCPGTASEAAGTAEACQGCPNQAECQTAPKGPDPDLAAIAQRLSRVKHKLLVLSGKGGVGKSTFSAQLAFALAAKGHQVGLLDIDICGPSVPKMLGLEGEEIHQSGTGWSPVFVEDNLGVMSIGFMLQGADDPVIWRGPRKNGLIKQFLRDVDWGELDFLVIDSPPGTSDEHISVVQYLKSSQVDGAVIVTTPQEVSIIDVRKEINFCKKVGMPVLGVVENMSGLQQSLAAFRFLAPGPDGSTQDVSDQVLQAISAALPSSQGITATMDIFHPSGGGAEKMAKSMGVPFLGRVPLDPHLSQAAERGESAFEGNGAKSSSSVALSSIIGGLLARVSSGAVSSNGHHYNGLSAGDIT